MVSQEARALIDRMTQEELLEEFNRQNRSRFQGDNYAYLKTRLSILEEEEEKNHHERLIKLAEDANRISGESNEIARGASSTANKAYRLAALSVVVALLSVLVATLSQCSIEP